MRIASFEHEGLTSVGVATENGEGLVDVARLLGDSFRDLSSVLVRNELPLLVSKFVARSDMAPHHHVRDVKFLPVLLNPEKILCVGLNYDAHRVETGRDETEYPVLFTRFRSTLVGHSQAIIRPKVSTRLDYEGELAVIIGRRGRHVPIEGALDLVAGYSCFNDASVRDWQRHTHQFTPGKNFPSTGAIGPWLVTAEDVPNPQDLDLRTRVNGTEVQHGHTSQMIFGVATLIHYISQFCELVPGDIIATGTPSGVGYRRSPPLYLAPGDRVEVEIEKLGCLFNFVQDE